MSATTAAVAASNGENHARRLQDNVVRAGLCTGCGACVAVARGGQAHMRNTPRGPEPVFGNDVVPALGYTACPGKGFPFHDLYRRHYGRVPARWIVGHVERARVAHAADPTHRLRGASGGVITTVLRELLARGEIDGAIVVEQGHETPEHAKAYLATSADAIDRSAQSVYVPVSVLDQLATLPAHGRYAMVCLPDQAAALRLLQLGGFEPARRITHVLGPYTGTALYPAAIRAYLRMHGVRRDDAITRLRWRAGDWPGYLEIVTASGRVLRSPKVYYNFLIPFFVTHTSLQHPDFGNEFVDLSVGDAWSPTLEASGGGHSVTVTRAPAMERFIATLVADGVLTAEDIDPLQATEMHGHMIDFKKRGSHIRNRLRRALGRRVPDFHMVPAPLPPARVAVEAVIIVILALCSNPLARWVLGFVPEGIIGPVFNRTRLTWKRLSKPTKRKGLAELDYRETP